MPISIKRKTGGTIVINEEITIEITRVYKGEVVLHIDADKSIPVRRGEQPVRQISKKLTNED